MPDQIKIKETVAYYIKRIVCLQVSYTNSILKEFDLTRSQLGILAYLHEQLTENPQKVITQKDIEDFFGIAHTTVIGLLNRLKGKGFITVTVNETDKRHRDVKLTQKALSLQHEITDRAVDVINIFEDALSEEQVKNLKDMLTIVYKNLKQKTESIINEKKIQERILKNEESVSISDNNIDAVFFGDN